MGEIFPTQFSLVPALQLERELTAATFAHTRQNERMVNFHLTNGRAPRQQMKAHYDS